MSNLEPCFSTDADLSGVAGEAHRIVESCAGIEAYLCAVGEDDVHFSAVRYFDCVDCRGKAIVFGDCDKMFCDKEYHCDCSGIENGKAPPADIPSAL